MEGTSDSSQRQNDHTGRPNTTATPDQPAWHIDDYDKALFDYDYETCERGCRLIVEDETGPALTRIKALKLLAACIDDAEQNRDFERQAWAIWEDHESKARLEPDECKPYLKELNFIKLIIEIREDPANADPPESTKASPKSATPPSKRRPATKPKHLVEDWLGSSSPTSPPFSPPSSPGERRGRKSRRRQPALDKPKGAGRRTASQEERSDDKENKTFELPLR